MIQRIQSLFLVGTIVILIVVAFWLSLFDFITSDAIYRFDGNGISKSSRVNQELLNQVDIPIYGILILLAGLGTLALFSFKNLDKQLRYTKLLWGFYIIVIFGTVVWRYFFATNQIEGEIIHHQFSYGFYLLVIGLPFIQLAIVNISKDMKKIDSINRIR